MSDKNKDNSNSSSSSTSSHGWVNWEAYYFNHGGHIAFLNLMLATNIFMAVWGIWEFTIPNWSTDSNILRITLPIARGAGRIVTYNAAILLLSASLTIIVNGCIIHSIPQIVNYATELKLRGGVIWTFGNGFATTQLLVTGILLLVVFLGLFYVMTLEKVRGTTNGFRYFWLCHAIGILLAFPLLIIHGTIRGHPITLYFTALPICLYVFDVVMRRIVLLPLDTKLIEIRATTSQGGGDDESVVKLVLQSNEFKYQPGQYAEINVPQISIYEWHPFTIASAPNDDDHVVFYIKALGKWTNQLLELAQKLDGTNTPLDLINVEIRGPFGAPAQNFGDYRHLLVVGSGIGVTPLLSVWQHCAKETMAKTTTRTSTTTTSTTSGAAATASTTTASTTQGTANPTATAVLMNPNKTTKKEDAPGRKALSHSIRLTDEAMEEFLRATDVNTVDVIQFDDRPIKTLRARAAYMASVLESMTVNIFLFCFALYMEVLVFGVWIYELKVEGAILQLVASSIALLVFGSKFVLSMMAYGLRYLASTVFLLETGIILSDCVAMITSITAIQSPSREEAIAYFGFFAVYILLHAVRIFHIFYATARPPKIPELESDKSASGAPTDDGSGIASIVGVWVSRNYSAMSFAMDDLVRTVCDLSSVFSLQLYATRESQDVVDRVNPFSDGDSSKNNHALHAGRPDWEAILSESIERAHGTNPEGERVGVFFCGSPAIARTLQRVAQQVTASHQYNTKMENGTACRCRVMVHKENF